MEPSEVDVEVFRIILNEQSSDSKMEVVVYFGWQDGEEHVHSAQVSVFIEKGPYTLQALRDKAVEQARQLLRGFADAPEE
jgi:hypothetical protein